MTYSLGLHDSHSMARQRKESTLTNIHVLQQMEISVMSTETPKPGLRHYRNTFTRCKNNDKHFLHYQVDLVIVKEAIFPPPGLLHSQHFNLLTSSGSNFSH